MYLRTLALEASNPRQAASRYSDIIRRRSTWAPSLLIAGLLGPAFVGLLTALVPGTAALPQLARLALFGTITFLPFSVVYFLYHRRLRGWARSAGYVVVPFLATWNALGDYLRALAAGFAAFPLLLPCIPLYHFLPSSVLDIYAFAAIGYALLSMLLVPESMLDPRLLLPTPRVWWMALRFNPGALVTFVVGIALVHPAVAKQWVDWIPLPEESVLGVCSLLLVWFSSVPLPKLNGRRRAASSAPHRHRRILVHDLSRLGLVRCDLHAERFGDASFRIAELKTNLTMFDLQSPPAQLALLEILRRLQPEVGNPPDALDRAAAYEELAAFERQIRATPHPEPLVVATIEATRQVIYPYEGRYAAIADVVAAHGGALDLKVRCGQVHIYEDTRTRQYGPGSVLYQVASNSQTRPFIEVRGNPTVGDAVGYGVSETSWGAVIHCFCQL